jgi:hypothetical protein
MFAVTNKFNCYVYHSIVEYNFVKFYNNSGAALFTNKLQYCLFFPITVNKVLYVIGCCRTNEDELWTTSGWRGRSY